MKRNSDIFKSSLASGFQGRKIACSFSLLVRRAFELARIIVTWKAVRWFHRELAYILKQGPVSPARKPALVLEQAGSLRNHGNDIQNYLNLITFYCMFVKFSSFKLLVRESRKFCSFFPLARLSCQGSLQKASLFCETPDLQTTKKSACQNKNERGPHLQITYLAECLFEGCPDRKDTVPTRGKEALKSTGQRRLAIILLLSILLQFFTPFEALAREFDYSIYDALLRKHVADGQVDYLAWKKNDLEVFEKYIKSLKDVSMKDMGEDEQKAFWINAYNVLTIYGVLKHIPDRNFLARFFSVMMVSGFFDTISYDIAGESLTLDDIEHKKLRAIFKDPRIHFTIVCASRSCPEIQGTAFKAEALDARLDRSARSFVQDKTKNRLDKKKRILYLSEIFNWFAEDFIGEAGSVIDFLKQYLSEEDIQYLSDNEVQVKYLFYDWLVNIKR